MSPHLKIAISSMLLLLTLSACKPGVYYPFGDSNAQPANTTSQGSANAAAQTASQNPTMIVPS